MLAPMMVYLDAVKSEKYQCLKSEENCVLGLYLDCGPLSKGKAKADFWRVNFGDILFPRLNILKNTLLKCLGPLRSYI